MTTAAVRHFVEYLYPGFPILNVSSPEEIVEREVTELPEGAIGYRFFDGTPDKKENLSGWHYKGEKLTVKQLNEVLKNIENEPGSHTGKAYQRERIEEMLLKMDGYDVVVTKDDQMFRLYEGDTVLS